MQKKTKGLAQTHSISQEDSGSTTLSCDSYTYSYFRRETSETCERDEFFSPSLSFLRLSVELRSFVLELSRSSTISAG